MRFRKQNVVEEKGGNSIDDLDEELNNGEITPEEWGFDVGYYGMC